MNYLTVFFTALAVCSTLASKTESIKKMSKKGQVYYQIFIGDRLEWVIYSSTTKADHEALAITLDMITEHGCDDDVTLVSIKGKKKTLARVKGPTSP